jgi:tetratricopeptide (TPR) repeat protein
LKDKKAVQKSKKNTRPGNPEGSSPSRAERPAPERWLCLLVLLGVGAGIYVNSLGGDFVWDDRALVLKNPMVQSLGQSLEAFQGKLRLFNTAIGYYRPLALLSIVLDCTVWGERTFGFHLTNLLLHLGCVLALFFLLERLFGRWTALWTSGLFAAFAVHTENVAFISGRMDVLCTLFILLCLLVYFRHSPPSPASLIFCFLLTLGALLSKELGAVLLFLLPLGVLFHCSSETWKGHFLRLSAFLIPAFVVYLLLRIQAIGGLATPVHPPFGLAQRLLFLPELLLRYLALQVFPLNLNAMHRIYPPPNIPGFLVPLSLLIIVAFTLFLLSRRSRLVGLGSLWFLAALLPVMNLLPMVVPMMADRFLYLPSAGFALLLTGIPEALERKKGKGNPSIKRGLWVVLLAIGLANGVFTVLRNPVWKDEMTLFTRCVEQSPGSALARNNLGYVYYREGDWQRAEQEYRRAIALSPGFADPHATLGDILSKTGRYAEAVREYEAYLQYNPGALNRAQALEAIRRLEILLEGGAP